MAIVASTVATFFGDVLLPLGVAIWVLYFVPVALSKFAWRPRVPLVVAATCSTLIVVGYVLSPGAASAAARFAPLNRTFGVVTLWIAAGIGRMFILNRLAVAREARLKAAQAALAARLQSDTTHAALGEHAIAFLAELLGAHVGALYLFDGKGAFHRQGVHALDVAERTRETVRFGEGLLGQVARDNRLLHLKDVPDGYLGLRSGLGAHRPREIVIAPASVHDKVYAVLELGFLNGVSPADIEIFERVSETLAAAVRSVIDWTTQQELLEETQRQAEELQTQEEQLRVQNEELEQQSKVLHASQAELESQHAELEQTNSQLEAQADALERERDRLARAQADLQRANAYKSEFMANMSHELRTPLNSSLILAKLLADNREGTLTPEQIKFAQTIYSAGNDLLTLINDILDLSKIEAGKLDVRPEDVPLARLVVDLENTFMPVAKERGLELSITVERDAPSVVFTDNTRLQQVLKNLLSNALKFTERGGVRVRIRRANEHDVAFDVTDTGIGIPKDQTDTIFEAFRQLDGSANRKFGGTGLGLSISRDLARLLGGDLAVVSEEGRGSTFTVIVPERIAETKANGTPRTAARVEALPRPAAAPRLLAHRATAPRPTTAKVVEDDRQHLKAGARSILVIEDDEKFARVLHDLAHELEFQALVATTAEDGLEMAAQYRPSAIVLDIGLPDRSGLSVLDALKHDPATRHIPVHVISAANYAQTALEMGATGYAVKPVERKQLVDAFRRLEAKFTQKLRRVLVVEDDARHRDTIAQLLAGEGVEVYGVGTGGEALEQLAKTTFDCMVLDLTLPDRSGHELLEEMSRSEHSSFPPVIVYTGRSLSREEEQQLRRFSSSIIVKGARSPERLLDEVTLFLHQVESELPADRQRMLRDARHREAVFEGKRVLVVEDDVRNIFALSSVLEPKGARVEVARNGREALTRLGDTPNFDLVLMDIMMPEMDGLEATREIRKRPGLAKLPIIALTAKAMADDRESCLAAGADDYIAKPLDVDKLLSLARVWMAR